MEERALERNKTYRLLDTRGKGNASHQMTESFFVAWFSEMGKILTRLWISYSLLFFQRTGHSIPTPTYIISPIVALISIKSLSTPPGSPKSDTVPECIQLRNKVESKNPSPGIIDKPRPHLTYVRACMYDCPAFFCNCHFVSIHHPPFPL